MKRIQTIIEEWQYTWLSKESERQKISMAALMRRLLTEVIERQQTLKTATDPIFGIIGLGEGPDDGITSENLDEYLYRLDRDPPTFLSVAEPPAPEWESAHEAVHP